MSTISRTCFAMVFCEPMDGWGISNFINQGLTLTRFPASVLILSPWRNLAIYDFPMVGLITFPACWTPCWTISSMILMEFTTTAIASLLWFSCFLWFGLVLWMLPHLILWLLTYFDQTSWTLGDICIEIQCACQIKDRFAECVTLNSHNACRQLDIVEDSES